MLALILCIVFLLLLVIVTAYAERKVAAFIQDRVGPTETGPHGILQSLVDVLKLLQKEDIIPSAADKRLFALTPHCDVCGGAGRLCRYSHYAYRPLLRALTWVFFICWPLFL